MRDRQELGVRRSALLFCAAFGLLARPAMAHPIHTTLTVITPDDAHGVLTLTIRAFADDFSASVARFAGREPPADSSVATGQVTNYVRDKFHVGGADGVGFTLEPCGIRRADELYWLCFRVSVPRSVRGTRFRNQLLTELHSDQVNIVQLEHGTTRKSFLFTKGSADSVLP